jgi:LuxR family maltose regulon positive regulatory protein
MQEALAHLQEACHLAEPEGYIRLFADEGRPLTELLGALAMQIDHGSLRGYVEQLIAVIEKEMAAPNQTLAELLTERELEILRLIAVGYSNQDIAATLVLGVSTVKWHVSNLLGKLNTDRRDQAVRRARELGLL